MQDRGVIFDLDGTLVHSSPDIALHLNAALGRLRPGGEALSVADVENLIGGGMQELVMNGLNAIGIEASTALIDETIRHFRDAYEAEPVVETTLYDGVVELLTILREDGFRIGLCTNKRELTANLVLQHFKLDHLFDAVVGGDTTPERKPDPTSLIEAAGRLGLKPASTVMVGDSRADFGAARAAGVPVILVDWGYSSVDIHSLGGDAVIASYAEFDAALRPMLMAS